MAAILREKAGDAYVRRWPRSKASDDRAVIVIRFGRNPDLCRESDDA
jgi:hypothetical protein